MYGCQCVCVCVCVCVWVCVYMHVCLRVCVEHLRIHAYSAANQYIVVGPKLCFCFQLSSFSCTDKPIKIRPTNFDSDIIFAIASKQTT